MWLRSISRGAGKKTTVLQHPKANLTQRFAGCLPAVLTWPCGRHDGIEFHRMGIEIEKVMSLGLTRQSASKVMALGLKKAMDIRFERATAGDQVSACLCCDRATAEEAYRKADRPGTNADHNIGRKGGCHTPSQGFQMLTPLLTAERAPKGWRGWDMAQNHSQIAGKWTF